MNLRHQNFSIAPMMDWTDRHCRYFHRLLSKQAILYTEMVTADAIIHGNHEKLLGYNQDHEHPIILQVGGSDPEKIYRALRIADQYDYDGYNLNVGCPSDRVQSGAFGACLMRNPALVGHIVQAMKLDTDKLISVKCRIGVDDENPCETLPQFLDTVSNYGCDNFIIHARKAWLKGLSPKENRDIPPLDYQLVYKMKQDFPNLYIGINGGIDIPEYWHEHLKYVDEIMVGRSAYHRPEQLLEVDRQIYNVDHNEVLIKTVIEKMADYCDDQMQKGFKFMAIARHMLGLFHGKKGARQWRRLLTEKGTQDHVDSNLLLEAFAQVDVSY